ncbi:unnamed protein product [Pieris brassicae]|uniref:Uncharacterized protein n=1 Tax=Pieris brassicae TaxID=7116 RepID=A0A9P0X9W0_PIEBR|nr:unnamed protein product [Pieris brassicae]
MRIKGGMGLDAYYNAVGVLSYLTIIRAKDVRIQLDSQDLLNIIKGLILKDVPVHTTGVLSNFRSQYRNPYHPEDGLVDEHTKEVFSRKINKSKNDVDQKIDEENQIFLNDPNEISEDELEEISTKPDTVESNKIDSALMT